MSREDILDNVKLVCGQIQAGARTLASLPLDSPRSSIVLGMLRELMDEVTHCFLALELDRTLQVHTEVVNSNGVRLYYRGCEIGGLRFATQSGEFNYHIKVKRLEPGGFHGLLDSGPLERFSFHVRH